MILLNHESGRSTATAADRRREPRYEANEPLDLYVSDGQSKAWLGEGILRDIATSGACFTAPFRLDIGTEVQLKWSFGDVRAVVRHCGAVSEAYIMGVEFVDKLEAAADSEWSPLPATW